MDRSFLDLDRYKWREVTGEPGQSIKIRHDYTILGYDLAAGTLDMLVRWKGDGGHCPIHRHTSTTTVASLRTSAVRDGDEWVINGPIRCLPRPGSKPWATGTV